MDKELILKTLENEPFITIKKLAEVHQTSYSKMRKYLADNNIYTKSTSERLALRNKLLCTKPPITISEDANQIIIGSLLGDGTIVRKGANCIFSIRHSLVQRDYLLYKCKLLREAGLKIRYTEREKSYKTSVIDGRKIKDNGFCVAETITNQSFNKYRNEWYIPEKEVPDSIYQLSALGLAIWYMDDGAIHRPTGVYFSTQGFNYESLLKLQDMMMTNFNLKVHIHKNKNKEILYLIQKDVQRFFTLIEPYICESMKYKIIGHNKRGELLES